MLQESNISKFKSEVQSSQVCLLSVTTIFSIFQLCGTHTLEYIPHLFCFVIVCSGKSLFARDPSRCCVQQLMTKSEGIIADEVNGSIF